MSRLLDLGNPTAHSPLKLVAEFDAVGRFFMLDEFDREIGRRNSVMLTVEQVGLLVEYLKTAPTMYDQLAEEAAEKAAKGTK